MAGRPRGAWADKAWRDAVRRAVMRPPNFSEKPKTNLDAAAMALIERCRDADIAAIKEMGDRVDGKVPQALQHTGDEGGPVKHVHRVELVDLA